MFNLQGSEIIVILLLALVVLGPEKLPDAIRRFTRTYSELKKMGTGFQSELKSALDEPMREMRETANLVRDAADPNRLVAEAEAEQRLRDDSKGAEPPAAPVEPGETTDPASTIDPVGSSEATVAGNGSGGVLDPGSEAVATPGEPAAGSADEGTAT